MIFLEGVILGFSMILFIGPVFFTLIQSTLSYGKPAGFAVALGIIVSDILCVAIYYLGLDAVHLSTNSKLILGTIGVLLLVGLGIKYLFQKTEYSSGTDSISVKTLTRLFFNGFVINFINPFVFLIWAGVYLIALEKLPKGTGILVFLTGVLIGIFIMDLLKVLFSHKIKHYLKPKFLDTVTKITGVILIGFSIRIVLYLFAL